jgi:hypothetical protein
MRGWSGVAGQPVVAGQAWRVNPSGWLGVAGLPWWLVRHGGWGQPWSSDGVEDQLVIELGGEIGQPR